MGLGGNLGDVPAAIRGAIERLDILPATRVAACSSLYRNPPLPTPGQVTPQPEYVNAVAAVDSALSPHELLNHLLAVERVAGRVRGEQRWGSRTLDLDLLLYGDRVSHDKQLTLPHPGAHERPFVVHLLAEIDGDVTIPGHGRVADLCLRVPGDRLVRIGSALT